MLPRLLLMLWVPLVVLGYLALGSGRAEAEEALASWYGPGFSGLPTATGDLYNPSGFTAAHKTLPLGTELLVSYGGNSVEVTVNDRGPYVDDRELDLSEGAAETLGLTESGVDYVEYAATGQYAAPPQNASTAQYASTTQYDSGLASAAQDTVEQSQYSTGSETVFEDQYASTGQAPQDEATLAPTGDGAPAPDDQPMDPGAGVVPGSLLVVRPGETLSELSVELGVPVDYLVARNGISDPDVIYAGQVLYY